MRHRDTPSVSTCKGAGNYKTDHITIFQIIPLRFLPLAFSFEHFSPSAVRRLPSAVCHSLIPVPLMPCALYCLLGLLGWLSLLRLIPFRIPPLVYGL